MTELAWEGPDADGLHVAWLSGRDKATLRGRRLRRRLEPTPLDVDTWPTEWRTLLAAWVRTCSSTNRTRWDTLLARAGAARANTALALHGALLASGDLEIEEKRETRGWACMHVRFVDPSRLRAALGLAEPDAARRRWQALADVPLGHADLDAARSALAEQNPRTALRRLALLDALRRWREDGRAEGHATQRDFALFATGSTKGVTDGDWRWLAGAVDLAHDGIHAHAPLLLIAAHAELAGAGGSLALGALGPFVALPPAAIAAVERVARAPRCWRLVENRTVFDRLAPQLAEDEALVHLPGYPPGWWREAMNRLLELAPAPAEIACDPDPDGIAIALQAGALWVAQGLDWRPWCMDSADLAALAHRRPLSERDRRLLGDLRARDLPARLDALAAWMDECGEKGEQEGIFPTDRGAANDS